MPVRFAPEVGMRWDHVTSNFHALHMDGWMDGFTHMQPKKVDQTLVPFAISP